MTTARKVLLIVATVLVVTGAIIAGSAFALAGGDMQNLSNDNRAWARQTQEIPVEDVAAITSIEAHEPARRRETTAAPGLCAKAYLPA